MELNDVKKIIEALLFITEQPVSIKTLEALFELSVPREQLQQLLQTLTQEYADRGSALEVREIAGGWQFSSRPEFAPWIRKLFKDRLTYRLSSSAMETLSIVAYKQPITRSEIEEIRGVEVTAVLDTLVERKLVRIAGRKETVGRPLLYGTTPDFLRSFGLKRLEDLPSIESLVPPAAAAAAEPAAAENVPAEIQG
jgi:segregation and condensation protein B